MGGNDTASLAQLMSGFEAGAPLAPSADLLAACRSEMTSERVADDEVLATIADVHARTGGFTLDPHSAIGVAAAKQYLAKTSSASPMICLACAHWAKFAKAVGNAIGEEKLQQMPLPEPLASLHTMPTRVKKLPNTTDTVKSFIAETVAERKRS
eukprot:6212903-Pleurochrysis_carterae.AAC.4